MVFETDSCKWDDNDMFVSMRKGIGYGLYGTE